MRVVGDNCRIVRHALLQVIIFTFCGSAPLAGQASPAQSAPVTHEPPRTSVATTPALTASSAVKVVDQPAARKLSKPLIHVIRVQEPGTQPAPFAIAGAQALYFGGPVISNVHVIAVLYGSGAYLPNIAGTATPTLGQFFTDLTQSSYMDMLSEYTTVGLTAVDGTTGTNQIIGHGSFDGLFAISPAAANNGTVITDNQIQAELLNQVTAGSLPAPVVDAQGNNNTLYMIYFPPGKTITAGGVTSCVRNGFCAYHNSTSGTFSSRRLFYGVHPDVQPPSGCSTGCGAGSLFDMVTNVSSHEFSEAVSDPDVGPATTLGRPLAWIDPVNSEIGDICVAQEDTITVNNTNYAVQREFSNLQNDCVSRTPLFRMTAGPDVVAGQSFDLDLQIASSASSLLLGAYSGTVHFTSSDSTAVLPADYTFSFADGGAHHFIATLNSSGSQTITVTDKLLPGFHGTATLGVNVPDVSTLSIAGPSNPPLATPATFIVTALDAGRNQVTNYNGTVHFSSTDPSAVLPGDTVLVNGTGSFAITLNSPGQQTLQVVDKAVPGISGSILMTGVPADPNGTTTSVSGCSTPLLFGQNCVVTVTVTGSTSTTAAGTFNASLDGVTFISGGISFPIGVSVAPSGGTHTFYANYFGNGTALPSSSGPLTITVNPAPSTLSLSALPSSAQFGTPVTISANIVPGSGRGTVTFFDGTNPIAILPASQAFNPGLTLSALPVGSHSITASYSGSPDLQPSSSSAAVVEVISPAPPANYSLKASPSSATLLAGQAAQFQITTSSLSGFTGTVKFSCGSLPSATSCTFSPPITFVSGSLLNATTVLTVKTSGPRAELLPVAPSGNAQHNALWWATSPFVLGMMIVMSAGRCQKRRFYWLGALTLVLCLALVSCGGGGTPPPPPPPPPPVVTPSGTTVIQVNTTGTASSGASPANPTQQLSISITVQ